MTKFNFLHKISGNGRQKPLQSQNRVSAPIEAPYRLVGIMTILAIIASVCMIIITFRDSLINKRYNSMLSEFYHYTSKHGWALDDIIIEGRNKTNRQEIIDKINLTRENNILEIDLKDLKQKIEELPWVRNADIKRGYFPNIIQINLQEKDVIALWQSGSEFYPVDSTGKIIKDNYIPKQPILVIVGNDAPEQINELLAVTSTAPELNTRIKAAILYASRRWDIIFDNLKDGILVKLPEKNLPQAWEKFIKLNNQHGLLKRKLTIIDLRYDNKLSVTVDSSETH